MSVLWQSCFEGGAGLAFVKPVFNASVKSINKKDVDRYITHETSTNRMLTSDMEKIRVQ